ncbi:hypothetical protein LEP1GSC021_4532 [Leptospira noguchii str. 1993005606]|nr:hypothetical protein LEP1GSC021_4532 [Leptospira noguchii str. 1993005606]
MRTTDKTLKFQERSPIQNCLAQNKFSSSKNSPRSVFWELKLFALMRYWNIPFLQYEQNQNFGKLRKIAENSRFKQVLCR